MNAREETLGRIRHALAGAPGRDQEVPRGYRTTAPDTDLVTLFVDRVEDYRATVTRCAPSEVDSAVESALGGAARVVVPDGFPHAVANAVPDRGPDGRLDALELDRVDAVVTTAALGIALTGTIVLDHGPGQGRRAVSLVPDLHVCVVRADQIVPGLPQAVAALDPRRPQTWISGPSATSDIELSRVEGVHGPRRLHVVVADGSEES